MSERDDRAPVSCGWCGRSEPTTPPGWTWQRDAHRTRWLCVACTREQLRSIEGRLDAFG